MKSRLLPMTTAVAALVVASAVFSSCNKSSSPTAEPAAPAAVSQTSADDLAKRGRAVYQSACIACHNPDPKKSGSLGPDVWGSSFELLEARVIRGEYPAGYKPKRSTHVMQPLPQVKNDLEALRAYLNH